MTERAEHSEADQRAHLTVSAAAALMRPTMSRLRNGISSHSVPGSVSFGLLESFIQQARGALHPHPEERLFLGSIDGDVYMSAHVRAREGLGDAGAAASAGAGSKRKRRRDDCGDRAEQAVSTVRDRVRGTPDAASMLAAVELARAVIEQVLRNVRGARNEEVVESCGLSLAPATQLTASAGGGPPAGGAAPGRPRLIIAARLSAGVPMPIMALRAALGDCFADGMITTRPETLGPSYQLPLSAAGEAVEQAGQRSMLLFAAVPTTAAPVAAPTASKASAAVPSAPTVPATTSARRA